MQGLAGDVAGLRRSQEQHRGGNVFRAAQPGHGNLRQQARALLFGQRPGHVGVDEARGDGVDGDAPRGHLPRQRLGEPEQRRPWRPQ